VCHSPLPGVGKLAMVVVRVQGPLGMCRCAAKPVGFLAREAYTSARGKYATHAV
jgi:hypothetical protein